MPPLLAVFRGDARDVPPPLFSSSLPAVAASDISIYLVSSRSSGPVAETVPFFYSRISEVVFSAPYLPFEGSYSVIVSTRRSRQLVTGIKELTAFVLY